MIRVKRNPEAVLFNIFTDFSKLLSQRRKRVPVLQIGMRREWDQLGRQPVHLNIRADVMLQETQRIMQVHLRELLQTPQRGFAVTQLVEAGHGHGLGGRAVFDDR
ncbi:hypothetical protein D3C81_1956520 [compost metagenome]